MRPSPLAHPLAVLRTTIGLTQKQLGALVNRVNHTDKITPWHFGAGALMSNLARRGLL